MKIFRGTQCTYDLVNGIVSDLNAGGTTVGQLNKLTELLGFAKRRRIPQQELQETLSKEYPWLKNLNKRVRDSPAIAVVILPISIAILSQIPAFISKGQAETNQQLGRLTIQAEKVVELL